MFAQAAEFEHVGPVTFDLKVVDDDKVDISISGNRNASGRRHMMNISRSNAAMEPVSSSKDIAAIWVAFFSPSPPKHASGLSSEAP